LCTKHYGCFLSSARMVAMASCLNADRSVSAFLSFVSLAIRDYSSPVSRHG
jgi:hypothetical protein